ncbi:MAG: aldehyde dehydrogenase [Chloroflexi bacterium]|nr:MAG: aldehyde dehydrogenase [Chloroflexota bacterium]
MDYKLYINGKWLDGSDRMAVYNKYNDQLIGTLPRVDQKQLDQALAAAEQGAQAMAELPAHRRATILFATAQALQARREEIAKLIAAEAGKALKFARIEVDRAISTFTLAGEEAKRLHGETVPLDAVPSGEGYFGFYVRRPVGVVAAITPFNFPLNLVAHKVAPALAAGNALVLKPAATTPLTAVILCECLEAAGLPPGAINLVNGAGRTVGEWLVTDPRVSKITFTGSVPVGERILSIAGIKKVTLAFYNSGQVCISTQRIYGQTQVYEPFTEKFVAATNALVVGDPLDERVDVGPLIAASEVERVAEWVHEATTGGARVLTGGKRQGNVYYPTVIANTTPDMKVVAEEVFGPVASVIQVDSFEEALAQADKTSFGLQASIFTRDINRVFQAIKRLNFGGVIINDVPSFRADHMPYGGNRNSGLGREGVKFAMEEMTNIQMVVIKTI